MYLYNSCLCYITHFDLLKKPEISTNILNLSGSVLNLLKKSDLGQKILDLKG